MSASHTTTPALSAGNDWRELALREGDGIEVRLLWSKSADRVKVTVADAKFDEEFEIDVAGADALAAFNHPFAYAASRSFGSRRGRARVPQPAFAGLKGTAMSPLKQSNNIAARMGRWSASHWKTATFGWLAFVIVVVRDRNRRHRCR